MSLACACRDRCSSGIIALEVGIASGVPSPVERGVHVPVPEPGGPYTPGLKPFPKPEGGKVSDPDLKRAAATGSGDTGCDDLRSEARSSSGDTPPFAVDDADGFADEIDGLVEVIVLEGVKVPPAVDVDEEEAPPLASKANESDPLPPPAAGDEVLILELPITGPANVFRVFMLLLPLPLPLL